MSDRSALPALLLVLGGLCIAVTAHAQFLSFGRSKITFESIDWRVMRTEHFDIYYDSAMTEMAARGARFAEESYARLEQDFGSTVLRRVPLIFYATPLRFRETNVTPGFIPEGVGGFFEFLKGRVVIPGGGSLEQFRHVINHELAHVFMHTRLERTLDLHTMRGDTYPPLWFVEGLAEFYSTAADGQARMVMRDAVISGGLAPISEIWTIQGTFQMYKEGQDALTFIARTFGRDKIPAMLDNLWKTPDFSEVMRLTIGLGYEEFDRAWLRDLRRRFYPQAAAHDRPVEVSASVAEDGFASKPVFVRRGDSACAVYMTNSDGHTNLALCRIGGGGARVLVSGERREEVEAFHILRGRPAAHADSLLAFSVRSGGSDVLHIAALADGAILRTLSFPGIAMIGSPAWSPDGRRIAFDGMAQSGETDLYIVDLGTRDVTRLTADLYDDRDPSWSPDGERLAFASDRGAFGTQGRHAIFTYDLATGGIRCVTADSGDCAMPAWSPDGRLLAFGSDLDGTPNLRLAAWPPPVSGLPVQRVVTRFFGGAMDPAWTDDGGLLFTAYDAGRFSVRLLPHIAPLADSLAADAAGIPAAGALCGAPWDAPAIALPSSVQRPVVEKEYDIDFAQSAISTDPVYGTTGGVALSMSDMFGDDRYNFLLYNTAQTTGELLSSFNIAVSRTMLGRRNPYSYGVFTYAGRRYDFLDPDVYYYERAFGGWFAAAYPFSTFQRLEGQVALSNSNREALYSNAMRKALILSNSVSWIFDNALYYYSGPLDGERMNLTLAYTTDIQNSTVNYSSVMVDVRKYFRLGLLSTLATRLEFLYNEGTQARRFYLGGSWDLRGWPRWSLRGTHRWLGSIELRFPLLQRVGFDFPFGPMNLGLLRGALYADAGNCWDNEYSGTLACVGAGLRFSLFGMLVLRYDFGKRIENNLTTVQTGWYQQFFFGYDF
jgi:hypothetical protein